MRRISIGKFAKEVGVSPDTLIKMQESGELIPIYITESGNRLYSAKQLEQAKLELSNTVQFGKKIRLLPTKEQEILFWKSAGTARWAFNYFLSENEKIYKAYLENGKQGKSVANEQEVRKYINNVLKQTTHKWLSEVGSNVMKQAVKDANAALKRYFDGYCEKPKFKKRHETKPSFYVNYETLSRKSGGFHGEKIGFVKTAEPLPKLPKGKKYSNSHITYDGKFWYLSVCYDRKVETEQLSGEILGIDVGVKNLAVCSNGKVYKNINRLRCVKNLERRLRREQRKLSRKILANVKEYKTFGTKRYPIWKRPLKECQNVQKQNAEIRLIYKKLANIRNNYLHQTTNEIVKTKPSQIVMETLNVRGMMKNKHLSKKVAQQKLYDFKRQIQYKSRLHGIKVVEADLFYPSSKKCSCCGHVKRFLKLSERIYHCDQCGFSMDRDFNASINLANYTV